MQLPVNKVFFFFLKGLSFMIIAIRVETVFSGVILEGVVVQSGRQIRIRKKMLARQLDISPK